MRHPGIPQVTDREAGFYVKDVEVAGEECTLVYAAPNAVWTEENKFFRSSIWTKKEKRLISAGWRKFTNLGEQPAFEPIRDRQGAEFVQKLDGTLLIVSMYRGELICRTRGSADVRELKNGEELAVLMAKYRPVFDNELLREEGCSILCEWTTPSNIIVLKETTEPTLWLLGVVSHEDYSYFTQPDVDVLAARWGVPRPKRYGFRSIEEMSEAVKEFKGCEGVVMYSDNWQNLKKVKSIEYLNLHKLRSALGSKKAVFDMIVKRMEEGGFGEKEFGEFVAGTFDWEIYDQIRGDVQGIFRGIEVGDRLIREWKEAVEGMKRRGLSRKEQALEIQASYPAYKSFLFSMLTNGELSLPEKAKLYAKLVFDSDGVGVTTAQ